MRAFYFIAISMLLSFPVHSQTPIQWQKCLGGTSEDRGHSIQQTTDGGYIVAGFTWSNDGDVTGNHGDRDYWVVKLSSTGAIEWQQALGGTGDDRANSIQQTTDGGYIVAGESSSNDGNVTGNHGGRDYWVVKLTNTGAIDWQQSLGGSGEDIANSIQQTTDGGYIVAGESDSIDGDVTGNHIGPDYWVVKLTNTGVIDWQQSFGGSFGDFANSIHQTTDGGYIVSGRSNSIDGDVIGNIHGASFWIVKISSAGVLEWQKSYGGTQYDIANSIQQTIDTGYIVAGYTLSNDGDVTGNHGGDDYWVVKLTNVGVIEWQKCLGGSNVDIAFSVQQTTDSGYIVAGMANSTNGDVTGNHGYSDFWVVKLTSEGAIVWEKSLGGTSGDQAYSIEQTAEGDYIVAGATWSNDGDVTGSHGYADYWIVKLDATIGVAENTYNSNIHVYPNPFVNQIHIKAEEPLKQVKIYDILGKLLLKENINFQQIDMSSLQSGIYLIKIETYSGIIAKKMIKE